MRSRGYEFYLRNQVSIASDWKDHVWERVRKSLKTEALRTVTAIFSNFFWKFDFCDIEIARQKNIVLLNFTGKLKPLETPFHLRNSMVFLAWFFSGFYVPEKQKNQIVAAKEYCFFSLFRSKISHEVKLLLLVHCSTITNTTASICC